jgi:hypothetical protein
LCPQSARPQPIIRNTGRRRRQKQPKRPSFADNRFWTMARAGAESGTLRLTVTPARKTRFKNGAFT